VLSTGVSQKVIAAPNATYTLSYPLKYPEYSSSSSPTIWFDGQHATITSGSAFPAGAALFYRPYLASQSAQPIEIENVRLVPWPYAGSAIRIDRPNGEATGANCFLRNIQATGGTDSGFGASVIYLGTPQWEVPAVMGYGCNVEDVFISNSPVGTGLNNTTPAQITVTNTNGTLSFSIPNTCSPTGTGTGSSICSGYGLVSPTIPLRVMPATNAPTTNYWTSSPWTGCTTNGYAVLNVSGGKGTTISNPVAYTGCGTTGNYGAYYGIAPDNGSAKHALWAYVNDGRIENVDISGNTNPSFSQFMEGTCTTGNGTATIGYSGGIGDALATGMWVTVEANSACSQIPNATDQIQSVIPTSSTAGSFAILCPGCTVGQTGTFSYTATTAYPPTAIDGIAGDIPLLNAHVWNADIGFNASGLVSNYMSDSLYVLSGILQGSGSVESARQFWNQNISSAGSQGYFFAGTSGEVRDVWCMGQQGNGGYNTLLTSGAILDNNLSSYPGGIFNSSDHNCGLSSYGTAFILNHSSPGSGAATGPTSSMAGDAAVFSGTGSQLQDAGAPPLVRSVPAWLQYLGTGADGANTNASGNMSGVYFYTNFTVPYGNTVTANTLFGLTIHATGTCTIAGTITASGNGVGTAGGSGGGGGGGAAIGTAGTGSGGPTGNTFLSGGSAGAASGGSGGSGGTPVVQLQRAASLGANGQDGLKLSGAGGGAGGSSGGAGGAASNGMVLICGSLIGTDGTHTGSITANGLSGGNATANNTGAGGGGGGGVIILSSQAAVSTWPTLSVAGGSGGGCLSYTGCGAGGAGGAGWTAEFSNW
jgi:hypothetical protein